MVEKASSLSPEDARRRNEQLDAKVFSKYCALTCMKKSRRLLKRISRPRAETRPTIREDLKKPNG